MLDSISKTVAKATTTVVGAAAVGVGAVIALSPLFTPEPIKEPDPISVSLVDFDVGGNYMLYDILCFDRSLILQGQVWRLFSYVFTSFSSSSK